MRAPLLLALLVSPGLAGAEECPQEKAVYQDLAGGYRLSFAAVDANAAATTHLFTLMETRGKARLDGVVLDTDAPVRSNAILMKDCPEGDVTGSDLAACTGFDGYVYGIAADGSAGNLPPSASPASRSILLAGLGPALAASPLGQKLRLGTPPADIFTFAECRP